MSTFLLLFGLPFFLLDAWLNKDGILTFLIKSVEIDFSSFIVDHNYDFH